MIIRSLSKWMCLVFLNDFWDRIVMRRQNRQAAILNTRDQADEGSQIGQRAGQRGQGDVAGVDVRGQHEITEIVLPRCIDGSSEHDGTGCIFCGHTGLPLVLPQLRQSDREDRGY